MEKYLSPEPKKAFTIKSAPTHRNLLEEYHRVQMESLTRDTGERLGIEELEVRLKEYFDRRFIEKLKDLIRKEQGIERKNFKARVYRKLKQLIDNAVNHLEVDDIRELIEVMSLIENFLITIGTEGEVINFLFERNR